MYRDRKAKLREYNPRDHAVIPSCGGRVSNWFTGTERRHRRRTDASRVRLTPAPSSTMYHADHTRHDLVPQRAS